MVCVRIQENKERKGKKDKARPCRCHSFQRGRDLLSIYRSYAYLVFLKYSLSETAFYLVCMVFECQVMIKDNRTWFQKPQISYSCLIVSGVIFCTIFKIQPI